MRPCRLLPLALLGLLAGLPAAAQPAYRVADLNPTSPQNWSLYLEAGRRIAVIGNAFYFVANDGAEAGAELWRSDGTAAGTRLLKDICPGACSSTPQSLTVSNGNLFFIADDGVHGRQLWKSDGSATGTAMVAQILPPHSPWISDLIDAAGVVYFFAEDGVHGYELWTSDGTPEGTHLVKDIAPGSGWINGRFLATSGHTLLFAAEYGTQWMAPWVTDGTEAGTGRVADLRPGADAVAANYDPVSSGPDAIPLPQGGFLFAADDGTGTALWTTDGIPGGTTTRISAAGSPHGMTLFQGAVWFAATDAAGIEPWKSDGTPGGTARFKDIQPGGGSSDPRELTVVGNQLFFRAADGMHGAELWRSNGTATGTVQMADFNSGPADAFPFTPGVPMRYQLSPLGAGLAYFAFDGSRLQLLRTDGLTPPASLTTAGLADYIPYVQKDAVTMGGRLYFLAGSHDTQLWSSDGTVNGTGPLVELTTATSSVQLFNGKTYPGAFAAVGSELFFPATGGAPLAEIWKTDGTPAGTAHVAGVANDTIDACHAWGDGVVFQTNLGIGVNDGTPGNTRSLGAGSTNFTTLNGDLFYVSASPSNADPRQWLWKTTGTTAATVGSLAVAPLSSFSDSGRMTVSGGRVFVPGFENGGGYSLWASDGTAGGTVHLSGLAHGGDFSQLGRLVDVGGALFFTAYEYGYGWEVWKSDGTLAGTTMIKASGNSDDPSYDAFGEAAAFPGGPLFFVLRDVAMGVELWKSDGTAAGTVQVADILPGAGSSNPHQLTPAGDRLYFVADDGVHGDEPWVTDGTAGGTHLVADLLPGAESSHPDSLVAVGSTLLFSATDGVHGVEAWRTGGRALGTRMLQDIAPGPLSSTPSGFTAAGPNVYFAASDNTSGFELWAVPKTNALAIFADVPTNYFAWRFIEALAIHGVTGGCGGGNFCPGLQVNRAEAAVFLLVSRGETVPPATGTLFQDIPINYFAAPWIEELAREGLLSGCSVSPPLYCPSTALTRAQMAVMVVGGRHENPPPATGTRFADVPANYWAARWIEQLAADGITAGCGGGNFCPEQPLTRAEMAVFLAAAFHLPLP